jgi:hypothetical protein
VQSEYWVFEGDMNVKTSHRVGIKITTTQGAGQACERVYAPRNSLSRAPKSRVECFVHGTENMAAVYCAWDADSGERFSFEMEGLEANIARRRNFDEQHRVDKLKAKCAGWETGKTLQYAPLRILWSSGTDLLANESVGQVRERPCMSK